MRWGRLLVCVLVLLAACGDEGKGPDYSDGLRRNFLASCEQSSGGKEGACGCLIDELESRMTEAEFLELEGKGEDAFLVDDRVQGALAACR